MDKFPITKEGYSDLEKEHKKLKFEDRPEVIDQIAEAREHGDLKENAEYHAAREKQSFIEGRIQELENFIAKSEIIDVKAISGDRIVFGATVELIDDDTEEEKTYQIVGEYEANLEKGKISITSPIAKALIGKEEGDMVNVATPGGKKTYEVMSVKFI
jgi:transcription elongation factor GreA